MGGSTQIFRSATLAMTYSVMSSEDLDELQAGSPLHACGRCENFDVHFGDGDGTTAVDADGDGYYADGALLDCNDNDASVHPGAVETACDTVDKNCDGSTPTGTVTLATAGSSAAWNQVSCKLACAQKTLEVPGNDVDENCDGIVSDRDSDGYYNALDPALTAARISDPNTPADCDDQNPNIKPGAREQAGNSVDEDCDGYAVDADNDGYIARAQSGIDLSTVDGLRTNVPSAQAFNDCDDWDASINPNAQDLRREAVFAQFYFVNNANNVQRTAAMCNFIGTDGALNAAGRGLLLDVNCDGFFSDLDGDGLTAPGDTSLGADSSVDCDDLDPRVATVAGCPAATNASLDAGTCVPTPQPALTCTAGYAFSGATGSCLDINECLAGTYQCRDDQVCVNRPGSYTCNIPPAHLIAGSLQVSNIAEDGVTLTATAAQNASGAVTYTVWAQAGGFTGLDANSLTQYAQQGDPVTDLSNVLQYGLQGGTTYAVTLVAVDSVGNRVVYEPLTITTHPASLGVGNANNSAVSQITSNSAVFTFGAATGGTGDYNYTVYITTGQFRDSSRGSIQSQGTVVVNQDHAGAVNLTPLNSSAEYSVVALVDDGQTQVAYYIKTFTTAAAAPFVSRGRASLGYRPADVTSHSRRASSESPDSAQKVLRSRGPGLHPCD